MTAGGERGALGLSEWLAVWAPGNWLAICFTKDIAGGAPVEIEDGLDKLCCFGRVGGGWLVVWRLNCFLKGAGGGGGGGGGGHGPLRAAGGGAGGKGDTGETGLGAE